MIRLSVIPVISLSLMIGCSPSPAPVIEEALFCDIEEKRVFSQEEIDWRAENAPWNLARDFRTNLAWERENCTEKSPGE